MKFARYGAEIILLDIDYEKLLSVKNEAEAFDVRVLVYRCDISDEGEVNEPRDRRRDRKIREKFGKIDILVNNTARICFLASKEASYIAGQTIPIDGCRKTLG